MDHLVFVENAIKHNISIYDHDIEDGGFVGELARRIEMYKNSINLLRYNNQICYVDNINTFFKRFRCPNFDTFTKRAGDVQFLDILNFFWRRNINRFVLQSLQAK